MVKLREKSSRLLSLPKENTTRTDRARLGNFLTPRYPARARPLHWSELPEARNLVLEGVSGALSLIYDGRSSILGLGERDNPHTLPPPIPMPR